jgi:hypothetical protein
MRPTILLVMLTFFAGLTVAAQESVTIASGTQDLSRPISALLDQLRQREKISVTYEDPRYSNSADIEDVTSSVARNISETEKKYGHRTLVPRGRPMTFVYARNELRTPEGVEATIARMLREYRMLGGPTFGVVRDGSYLHVVPIDVLDAAGERVKQDSILNTIITIPPARRDGGQLIDAICDQVKKQTGYEIWVGTNAPSNNLAKFTTVEGIKSETAQTALENLLDKLALPNSFNWDLYYGPGEKAYALNFDYVGPAGPRHNAK